MKNPVSLSTLAALLLLGSSLHADGLKVYVLAGQSNMEGHARVETFDYIGDDPATAPMLEKMRAKDGSPLTRDDVWITYLTGRKGKNGEGFGPLCAGYGSRSNPGQDGGKIGPEYTFGIYMGEACADPVLIIKTAWGGKSLHTDFRPPSAGPYELTEDDIKRERFGTPEKKKALEAATGHYYRLMIEHVRYVLSDIKRVYPAYDEKAGYELAGFAWFQGFNDMVSRSVYPVIPEKRFAKYGVWMADFIRDVRKDLNAPEMKFVIGVMGVSGMNANEGNLAFREAMAAPASLPEFKGNVVAVQTAPFWDEPMAALDAKNGKVKQMSRMLRTKNKKHANADGKMTNQQQKEYIAKYRAEVFTPEEEALRKRGSSNAGYHYLGCGKTLALIGKAFAEAMQGMETGR